MTSRALRLSVLDLSPITRGGSAADALCNSVDLSWVGTLGRMAEEQIRAATSHLRPEPAT
jgi:hypothetical protein